MTLPSTNISMQGIATEAGGVSITNIYASDLFKKSYFEGPNGSYNISYNAWGQYGNSSGADKIYGLTTKNADNAWSDFSGLTYFYDNSTYLVGLQIQNTLPAPTGLNNNDYDVYVELWDSSYTYTYVSTGAINVAQGATYGPTIISTTSTPIINDGYWRITFVSNQLDPSVSPVYAEITVNTNLTTQTLTASPFSTDTFTGQDSVDGIPPSYTGTGLQFDIIIFK
jgi:hypothetical protein